MALKINNYFKNQQKYGTFPDNPPSFYKKVYEILLTMTLGHSVI